MKFICSFVLSLFAFQASATTIYSQAASSVSSLTISASTSGMTSKYYSVHAFAGGSKYLGGKSGACSTYAFCYSIDASTYDLTISSFNSSVFASGVFTGTIKLMSAYSGTDTTDSGDFALQGSGTQGTVWVMQGADSNPGYVLRSYGNIRWYGTSKGIITVSSSSGCVGTLYVYFSPVGTQGGQTTVGHSAGAACVTSTSHVVVASGSVTGYPSGSVPIGTVSQGLSASLVISTDDRPWAP